MLPFITRAGLVLGVLAATCAGVRSDDLRTTQSLVEAPIFLGQSEAEAAFARLDIDRGDDKDLVAKPKTFVDVGAASFGQAEHGDRLGYAGSANQLRVGVDRNLGGGVVLGAMTGSGAGGVSSGDLTGGTLAQHLDVYGRIDRGSTFAKLLFGGSLIGYRAIDRGPENARTFARAVGRSGRAAVQVGGSVEIQGIKVSPTVGLALHASALSGYSETGRGAASYNGRAAQAAIGSFRLRGSRSVRIDPVHKVKVEAFVGADEMAAFRTNALHARTADGSRIRTSLPGKPTGRGIVGGLGVGTSLADGVDVTLSYDYGERDGFETHAARGRIGLHF